MINYHIIKVTLKSKQTCYRTILTRNGKSFKSKTFRRKVDTRTWGSRMVLAYQETEANEKQKLIG